MNTKIIMKFREKVSLTTITLVLLCSNTVFGQKAEKFDIITFKAPAGWQKEVAKDAIQFGIDDKNGGICMITLFRSVPGSGDSKANFDASWETVVKELVTVSGEPQMQPAADENGWIAESGFAQYESDGKKGLVLLVTISGNSKMVNILILTNTEAFQQDIAAFLESVNLPKIENRKPTGNSPATDTTNNTSTEKLARTNFDEGWVSVAKADWVEVTKGQITVLLHYPKAGTDIAGDPEPRTIDAWNILVAPRYSDLKGFKVVSPTDYQRAYLGAGFLTDNQARRQVFVSLFQKAGTGWIEIITPDKNSFTNNFGFDIDNVMWDSSNAIWEPLIKMSAYNKFAISTSDFDGEWSDRFSSNSFYTNIYTGLDAGMSSYSSSEKFVFSGYKNFSWNLVASNSFQGRTAVGQGKSAGTFKVLNPWQINFSNIEGKPKTFNAYFSYIRGSKVLWMIDAQNPGSGIYTGYGLKNKF